LDVTKSFQLPGDEKPNLVILNLVLPGRSGLDVYRFIRRREI